MKSHRRNYRRYKDILLEPIIAKSERVKPLSQRELLHQQRTIIFKLLDEFYYQDDNLVRQWLHEPKKRLGGQTAYALMDSVEGCQRLEDLVHEMFVRDAKS